MLRNPNTASASLGSGKELELHSDNLKRQILFSDSARWPAAATDPYTALTWWGLSSQWFEYRHHSILTKCIIWVTKTHIWKWIMWTNFDQERSSKREKLESLSWEMPASRCAINFHSEASFKSTAIQPKHNHVNFGAPQFPELHACNHHSFALCWMTSHYAFIPL